MNGTKNDFYVYDNGRLAIQLEQWDPLCSIFGGWVHQFQPIRVFLWDPSWVSARVRRTSARAFHGPKYLVQFWSSFGPVVH